jgi:hypothetical protein
MKKQQRMNQQAKDKMTNDQKEEKRMISKIWECP